MGLTVVDAGVVIAVLDRADVHHQAAVGWLRDLQERDDATVLPASAYAECLVSPRRRGQEAVSVVDAFLDAFPIRIEPASRAIAREAADLRAHHGRSLRLPDALVVATAVVLGADHVLTTDAGWPPLAVAVEVVAGE